MTKEELKTDESKYIIELVIKDKLRKEAEEWLCNNLHSASEEDFIKAMIDIVEPREKQIQIDAEQIRALQKQNGALTDKVKELEAQIEKMKWHNLRIDPNDLPKDRHNVWIVYLNGYYQEERSVASYRHKFWVIGGLKTECEVIAWCELPKWEIKEK